eukprot:CAMPEP_0196768982 /NCGR_PEP_ID=MMETSP1104-20130614/251_1 /TAXON_ID=33652 /ORGANISM="Cafeteria sp., Strain Caron Lab Isolate" /LENGTH=40 /DNA_ID= /DNA_START= /DNA_END= /DNA_ORIENTATION=
MLAHSGPRMRVGWSGDVTDLDAARASSANARRGSSPATFP